MPALSCCTSVRHLALIALNGSIPFTLYGLDPLGETVRVALVAADTSWIHITNRSVFGGGALAGLPAWLAGWHTTASSISVHFLSSPLAFFVFLFLLLQHHLGQIVFFFFASSPSTSPQQYVSVTLLICDFPFNLTHSGCHFPFLTMVHKQALSGSCSLSLSLSFFFPFNLLAALAKLLLTREKNWPERINSLFYSIQVCFLLFALHHLFL